MSFNCADPLLCGSFLINTQLALCIPGFHVHGFNQPWITNGVFDLQLGLHGCGGLTVCIVLPHLYTGLEHLWILVSADVLELVPCGYKG